MEIFLIQTDLSSLAGTSLASKSTQKQLMEEKLMSHILLTEALCTLSKVDCTLIVLLISEV